MQVQLSILHCFVFVISKLARKMFLFLICCRVLSFFSLLNNVYCYHFYPYQLRHRQPRLPELLPGQIRIAMATRWRQYRTPSLSMHVAVEGKADIMVERTPIKPPSASKTSEEAPIPASTPASCDHALSQPPLPCTIPSALPASASPVSSDIPRKFPSSPYQPRALAILAYDSPHTHTIASVDSGCTAQPTALHPLPKHQSSVNVADRPLQTSASTTVTPSTATAALSSPTHHIPVLLGPQPDTPPRGTVRFVRASSLMPNLCEGGEAASVQVLSLSNPYHRKSINSPLHGGLASSLSRTGSDLAKPLEDLGSTNVRTSSHTISAAHVNVPSISVSYLSFIP